MQILEDVLYVNGDNFTSFSPVWIPFTIFFSCSIVLARISSVILNRSDKSEHSGLVPDLGSFQLFTITMMFTVGFL